MEVIIIGSGPGGYAAALHGAKNGLKITLIEKAELGGVCLNRGCIPTKTILHSANMFHQAKGFLSLGITANVEGVDYSVISKRKNEIVVRLRTGMGMSLKKAGVTIIQGEASLISEKKVKVLTESGEKTLSADKIIIATGAIPTELSAAPVDGDIIINSDHALALEELPESMAIVGGGVIGCEFAQAFARLGCKITIIEAMSQILPGTDVDAVGLLQKSLARDNIEIHLNSYVKKAVKTQKDVTVTFETPQGNMEITAQKLLVSIGRKSVIGDLGLDTVGIEHENGYIKINDRMATNIDNIYAIGDVAGGIQLAHVATYGGMVAINNILGKDASMSEISIPMCIYTDPEIAAVGLSVDAAKKEGLEYRVGAFPLSGNSRAMIDGASDGFSKIVVDNDDTILGSILVGPNVTEMISLLGSLVNFQATTGDINEIMFAHPSVSEIIVENSLALTK